MSERYTPSTEEIKGQACRLGGWHEAAFDRWLAAEKAQVWDKAYQAGAYDTLLSPRWATENPYRQGAST